MALRRSIAEPRGSAVNQAEIDKIAQSLAPDVVRIRYDFNSDWSGEHSIFFRIVLSDDASREDRLATVAGRVKNRLLEGLHLLEWDLLPYFNFRSKSEQEELEV